MLHRSNKVGHFDLNPNKVSLSSEGPTTPQIVDFVLVYTAKNAENDTEKPKDKSSNEKKRQNRDIFLKNLQTSGLEVNEVHSYLMQSFFNYCAVIYVFLRY